MLWMERQWIKPNAEVTFIPKLGQNLPSPVATPVDPYVQIEVVLLLNN